MRTTQTAIMDERGRVTLGKDRGNRYGKEFFVVDTPTEIVLIPKPKDPLKELRELGKKAGFKNMTADKIRKLAEEGAYKEVEGELGTTKAR